MMVETSEHKLHQSSPAEREPEAAKLGQPLQVREAHHKRQSNLFWFLTICLQLFLLRRLTVKRMSSGNLSSF